MSLKKIQIQSGLDSIHQMFTPIRLASVNDNQLMLVKVKGNDIPWHSHQGDEAFWVLSGAIQVFTRDQTIQLNAGEFLTIPAGVEHRIESEQLSEVLLVEAKGFKHTGQVTSSVTKASFESLS